MRTGADAVRLPIRIWIALGALVAAASVPVLHAVRERAARAGAWSDDPRILGRATPLDSPLLRHARWAAPIPLPDGVNTPAEESRATISPDGRWIVFAAGARGSNAGLWIAPVAGDEFGAARAVTELETSADELAPAFGPDGLYFASDRPGGAGGLDLYRARFDAGRFEAPERLDEALQSARDDTDPAPSPRGDALVLASDRERGFDLFSARVDAQGAWIVRRADALCSDADDREPAFDPSGTYLWFASSRGQGFDLFRAACAADGFGATERVDELSTPDDERAPMPVAHGFEVLFARAAPGGSLDLWRAHSVELARIPERPWSWLEIATLVGLLILALLAFLADRRPALDVLFQCYLVSLILHLLLAWWLHHVAVDVVNAPPDHEPGRKIKVQLEARSRTLSASQAERAGDVEALVSPAMVAPTTVARAQLEAPATPDERPASIAPAELRPPEDSAPRAPARTAQTFPPTRTAAPEAGALSDREEPASAPARPAPALALEARAFAVESGATRVIEPVRARLDSTDPTRARAADAGTPIDVARAVVPGAPPPARSVPGPRVDRAPKPAMLADGEAREREEARPAPALALEARAFADAPATDARDGPVRAQPGPALRSEAGAPAPITARLVPDLASSPQLLSPPPPRTAEGRVRTGTAREGLQDDGSKDGELQDREPMRASSGTDPTRAPASDLLAGLSEASARKRMPAAGPERARIDAPPDVAPASAPPPIALDAPVVHEIPPAPERGDWGGTPYENRTGAAKERALRDHGGGVETEAAVEKGLAYLARIQAPGGSWGPLDALDPKYGRVCVGKTALVTLAFLGAGHTHASRTLHSDTVARALSFLLRVQDPDSGHFGDSEAYSHGIATYALAEAYALTQEEALARALRPAIEHILAHQSRDPDPRLFGGWSYYYSDERTFDRWPRTSITAWQVMALESARLGGLDVPQRAFIDAERFIDGCLDGALGWYRYDHDPARLRSEYPTLPASTPAALFALSILGRDITSPAHARPLAFVVERAPRGFRYTGEDDFVQLGQGNPYFWYYGTLATFRAGGTVWSGWNAAMKRTLLPAQAADGSWKPIDAYAKYARDDARDKSYTTALAVLSLEVYYRYYLPLLRVR